MFNADNIPDRVLEKDHVFDASPFCPDINAGFRQRPTQRIWIFFPSFTSGLKKPGKQFASTLLLLALDLS